VRLPDIMEAVEVMDVKVLIAVIDLIIARHITINARTTIISKSYLLEYRESKKAQNKFETNFCKLGDYE
jgi:hypothetical protein